MRAAVYTRYGPPDVLRIEHVPDPSPGDGEVLIRVHATTVTAGDYRMRGYHVPPLFWLPGRIYAGILKPKRKILGTEFAGTVTAVGQGVQRFRAGDAVFGSTGGEFGAYAEYLCMPEEGVLALKPDRLSFEQAAAVPFGALTALFFLRDQGRIKSGQRVLINGASGGVGTAAVQVARYFGAEVTGVCSTANVEMVTSLGAHRVVDYTRADFTRENTAYDIIFDTVGNLSVTQSKKVLAPGGVFLAAVIQVQHLAHMLWASIAGGKRVVGTVVSEKAEDLMQIREMVAAGKLTPYIDRTYPLGRIAEAHRYAETGHKRGNVVITLV